MFKSSNYCIDCKRHLSHSDNYTTYTSDYEQYLRCQYCESKRINEQYRYYSQFQNGYNKFLP